MCATQALGALPVPHFQARTVVPPAGGRVVGVALLIAMACANQGSCMGCTCRAVVQSCATLPPALRWRLRNQVLLLDWVHHTHSNGRPVQFARILLPTGLRLAVCRANRSLRHERRR